MVQYKIFKPVICVALVLHLIGCQLNKNCDHKPIEAAYDPLKSMNQKTFQFNLALDRIFAAPIADTYRFVFPPEVRDGVHKVAKNLGEPHIITNDLLQGQWQQAKSDSMRFLINSTTGLAGTFDPATTLGYEAYEQNFGVTAGIWGIPEGPYLMLPIVGPTSLRGLPDLPLRQFTSPLSFLPVFIPFLEEASYVRPTVAGAKRLDEAASGRHHMKAIQGSINPYIFVRSGYRQQQLKMTRRVCKKENGNNVELLPLDDFE